MKVRDHLKTLKEPTEYTEKKVEILFDELDTTLIIQSKTEDYRKLLRKKKKEIDI